MKVLIGCPVFRRAWILNEWFAAIEAQTMPLSDIGFIFELGPKDDETHDLMWNWHMEHPQVQVFDGLIRNDQPHMEHQPEGRAWIPGHFYRMIEFRNNLLEQVINYQPDRYFSLDSDILLENPTTLERLYEECTPGTAVAPWVYMHPTDTEFPGVMNWKDRVGGPAKRELDKYPIGETFEAEIIMAAKMMSKEVYTNVRYRHHQQGEDLGWSAEVTRAGYKMKSVSDIYAPHIMHDWMLSAYKIGGDPRKPDLLHRPTQTLLNL